MIEALLRDRDYLQIIVYLRAHLSSASSDAARVTRCKKRWVTAASDSSYEMLVQVEMIMSEDRGLEKGSKGARGALPDELEDVMIDIMRDKMRLHSLYAPAHDQPPQRTPTPNTAPSVAKEQKTAEQNSPSS